MRSVLIKMLMANLIMLFSFSTADAFADIYKLPDAQSKNHNTSQETVQAAIQPNDHDIHITAVDSGYHYEPPTVVETKHEIIKDNFLSASKSFTIEAL